MTFHPSRAGIGALAPLALLLAACSAQDSTTADPATQDNLGRTVATVMAGNDDLSTFSEAMSQTGLSTMLDGPSSYTVIAPTNEAFAGSDGSEGMLDNDTPAPLLAALLREHIIPGALTPESIVEAIEAKGGAVEMRTLGSGTLTFDKDGENLVMRTAKGTDARLVSAAMVSNNGVLFPVDQVLVELPKAE